MSDEDDTATDPLAEPGHPKDRGGTGNHAPEGEQLLVGRYRLERLIDGGGMGDVYRTFDTRLKCTVALKKIKPELLKDPQFRLRYQLEAHAPAAINHSAVARTTDYHDDGGEIVFVVYEFVEGQTLHALLGEKRFSLDEILDIGTEIAEALATAHGKGFIHRDLKPKNIMLVPSEQATSRVKILDFGLAKKTKVVTAGSGETAIKDISKSELMIIGTPDYMSPEQAAPEPVDSRSDIYSLGLVLYEMAAGFNPFAGGSSDSARRRVLKMEAPPLPQSDPPAPPYAELDRILRKCLRKRPEERYQSAQELRADLVKLRDSVRGSGPQQRGVITSALPPPPIPRWLACTLFTVIQVGYLGMYAVAFYYLPDNVHRLPNVIREYGVTQFVLSTLLVLCAAATVRLYLLAAIAFDYEDLGRLFHRIFPAILILDLAWALSPLLLFLKLGFILLLAVPGLALLPFSQRTLVYCAYGRRGGRSSAAKATSSPALASGPDTFPPTPPSLWRG